MSAPPRPNLHHTLPEILTVGDVAALFRVDRKTVTRWDRSLRPFRTLGGAKGHRRYYRDVVVEAYEAKLAGVSL